MSKNKFRTITIDGDEYKWIVGNEKIIIRGPDNFKVMLDRPNDVPRWGVIYKHLDCYYGTHIKIFDDKAKAMEFYKSCDSYEEAEWTKLKPKTVSITPAYIARKIEDINVDSET